MTNTEAQTEIAAAEGIALAHEVSLTKFQVNLARPHIDDTYLGHTDQIKIAATIHARSDVTKAYIGPDNFLHVVYNPKGLRGDKRDAFVEKIAAAIRDVVEHKLIRVRMDELKRLAEADA